MAKKSSTNANLPSVSKQTAGGVTGAVIGGMVGGPIGAVVGGVLLSRHFDGYRDRGYRYDPWDMGGGRRNRGWY